MTPALKEHGVTVLVHRNHYRAFAAEADDVVTVVP
jgi:hypothetical protein